MLIPHQQLIKSVIDLNPYTINMYWGYKGDMVLKIETSSPDDANTIRLAAEELGLEAVPKFMSATKTYVVFCIAKDEDVYELKQ